MNKLKIAVFASGSGTNFQAILDKIHTGELSAEVGLLVCDRPAAEAVERAEKAGIPVFSFRPKEYPNREAYEAEILLKLEAAQIELIVLAGYMRIVTDTLVQPFFGRMINIHPSLLPSFPGIHAIEQAIAHGVKVTGVTVHFVDGGMDTGPIIAQQAVPIHANDTEDTITANIRQAEHRLYPSVIQWIAEGRVTLEENGKRAAIRQKSQTSEDGTKP